MTNQFTLQIDPYWCTASVKLDGTPISNYSPLAQLSSTPVKNWIHTLPQLLHQEVNGSYGLEVICHPFLALILHDIFDAQPQCTMFRCRIYQEQYTSLQRLAWAAEAAAALGCSLPPRKAFRIACDQALRSELSRLNHVQLCAPGEAGVDAVVTADPQTAASLSGFGGLVCSITAGPPAAKRTGTGIWMQVCAADAVAQLEHALDYLDCKRYLIACYGAMSANIGAAGVSFQTEARIRMLMQDHPCARLNIPAQIETGTPFSYSVDEFPSSSLSLQSLDPGALVIRNGRYYAGRVGKTNIRLFSAQGILLDEQPLDIYHVERVTAVTLDPGGQTVFLQGMQLQIRPCFTPSNAQNTALAVWTVSDPTVLRHLGNGKFLAVGHGTCKVTLTVERVSGSVDLRVHQMASDIQLPQQIQVKLASAGTAVSAPLYPANSACGRIAVRVLDPAVARWDEQMKTVHPVAEGHTELEICLYDAAGHPAVRKRCPVEVLPPKTVYNPIPSVVTAILLLFFCVFVPSPDVRAAAAFLLIPCGGWMIWDYVHQLRSGQPRSQWLLLSMIASSFLTAVVNLF